MSCCGQKRLAYKRETQNPTSYETDHSGAYETEKSPRVFEYTGTASLKVKGISSGAIYHFRFSGQRLEVDYYDSFAMMAERYLEIVT